MKKEIVGNVPGNILGMLADLAHKLQHGSTTPEQLAWFLKGMNPFEKPDPITDWQNFYSDVFNLKWTDITDVQIPAKQDGFDRLIIVVQGMTPQKLYDKCRELFPCWKWTDKDLDKITQSERTADKGHYAIWIRNRVEVDEELKNMSVNQLKAENIPGITLEERLLYELKYFKETEKHLDIEKITLCAGSRYSDGIVPDVDWYNDELRVHWYLSDSRGGVLRARRVVP